MKIKRYLAPDMRSALRLIREEQGADAVILSTRQLAEGVEVCSAVDLELAAGIGTLADAAALKQLGQTPQPLLDPPHAAALSEASPADTSVGAELRSLRELLEQQLAALAWNDFTRREPMRARALVDLTQIGIDRELALQIMSELPAELSSEQAQRLPYALLARRLAGCEPPGEQPGVLALVGPSGSGKTSLLSKLAVRWVLEHEPASLLIVSADDERLGSHEQLRTLGRLLGVGVTRAASLAQLDSSLFALPAQLVLIDTPGASLRDATVPEQIRALRDRSNVQTMLVLPASAQAGVIADAVTHFQDAVSCCALTRIDEAISLGGALSAVARARLPLAWCSDGPGIPEDLRRARAHQLVARAVELARQAKVQADDELLARRFGATLHAAA